MHIRIEQKFKDYRSAFRLFDLNHDGSISFEEFVVFAEFTGVQLPISDFRLIFDTLDYDGNGEIDFSEFCLINTDKTNNVHQYIKDARREKKKSEKREQMIAQSNIDHYYIGNKLEPLVPHY